MRKLTAAILVIISALTLSVTSYALNNITFGLDPDAGMFSTRDVGIDNETSATMELTCLGIKPDGEWNPMFGVKFVSDRQRVVLKFLLNRSGNAFNTVLVTYKHRGEDLEETSSIDLGRSVPRDETLKLHCTWHSKKLNIYLNGEKLAGPVDLNMRKMVFTCSAATLLVKNLNFGYGFWTSNAGEAIKWILIILLILGCSFLIFKYWRKRRAVGEKKPGGTLGSKLWKAYFFFMVLIFIASSLDVIMKPKLIGVIGVPLNLASLVALFGFSFNKKILMQRFWQGAFVLCILNEIYSIAETFIRYTFSMKLLIASILFLAILVPIYIAMFLYAFRKKALWAPA
ncbi:hypothetical protein ACFL5C_00380 [Candidatus Omnitrophota bacterium]